MRYLFGGGVSLPQNSYKPSRDIRESTTLLRRTRSVQRLGRSFGTNIQTNKEIYTLLLYYKDNPKNLYKAVYF